MEIVELMFFLQSQEEAKLIDRKLFDIWSMHPNFHLITSRDSFFEKIHESVVVFRKILEGLEEKSQRENGESENE